MLDVSPFRVDAGAGFDLSAHDPDSKLGFEAGKKAGKDALPQMRDQLSDLQRRLWAESRQALLVVIQAIDTGGKDGTIRHVFTGVNPQGVHVRGFRAPSHLELAHDFLWRIHKETPEAGAITIFNRSHYEDVLVVRVRELAPESTWRSRYGHIRDFERMLTDEGTRVVKLFLNISKEEQKKRLQARLDEPDKNWKFAKGDLDDRALWDDYRSAFQDAIAETSTGYAPWYVVPANRKWYRNLVVSSIMIQTLEEMDPRFPEPEDGLDEIVIK